MQGELQLIAKEITYHGTSNEFAHLRVYFIYIHMVYHIGSKCPYVLFL